MTPCFPPTPPAWLSASFSVPHFRCCAALVGGHEGSYMHVEGHSQPSCAAPACKRKRGSRLHHVRPMWHAPTRAEFVLDAGKRVSRASWYGACTRRTLLGAWRVAVPKPGMI